MCLSHALSLFNMLLYIHCVQELFNNQNIRATKFKTFDKPSIDTNSNSLLKQSGKCKNGACVRENYNYSVLTSKKSNLSHKFSTAN